MSVANTLQKPSFPVGLLRFRPESSGLPMKPLGISPGLLPDAMADLKCDAGKAMSALFSGLRASLPTLAR